MKKKVLIVSEGYSGSGYHGPFREFGEQTTDSELLWTRPKEIALIVFTGGADVSPSLYGEEAARGTVCVPKRDIFESIVFQRAKELNLPMAGVCRGAQFLNVMAGGKLCQHLDNHTYWHDIDTWDKERFEVSSTHHQMMLPPKDAKVLAWSAKKRSRNYWGELDRLISPAPELEYEVVYWPYIRAVGMQYHPEMMGQYTKGYKYAAHLVSKFLLA